MRFLRIIFAGSLFFIPLLSHAQGSGGFFGPPPPSCDDKYAACLAGINRIQTSINALGLSISQSYISGMKDGCRKAREHCIAREKEDKEYLEKMMAEYERLLTPKQKAVRDARIKESKRKFKEITDIIKKGPKNVIYQHNPDGSIKTDNLGRPVLKGIPVPPLGITPIHELTHPPATGAEVNEFYNREWIREQIKRGILPS